MQPLKVKLVENDKLNIKWDDGTETEMLLKELRRICPCAVCVAERAVQSKSYIPIYSASQITFNDIKLVGSYAISITWNDGHNTGIYEFSYLHKKFNTVKNLKTG